MSEHPEVKKTKHIRLSSLSDFEKARYFGLKKSMLVLFNLLMKKVDRLQNRTTLLSRPSSLQIEPTTKCNLRCPFCENMVWDRGGMDMKFSDFRRVIDQFPFLVVLLLQGIGEPLMCVDFFKMIEYCKSKRIITGITTNATLLDETTAKKIVESKLDYVIISMDGATPETFEKIRVGAKFNQVIENTRNLVDIRGKSKIPRISFHFSGTNENIHELPEVVKMAKDIGLDGVEAQEIHFWGDTELKKRIIKETLHQEVDTAKKFINEAMVVAKEMGILLDFLGTGGRSSISKDSIYYSEDQQLHADQRLCQQLFRSCFITVDGYVTTCACSPDPRKSNFGNILQQDFDTIWNSPKYSNFRKMRLGGKIPDYCRMCTTPHL